VLIAYNEMVKDLQKFMLNIIIVLLLSFKNISLFKSRKCPY